MLCFAWELMHHGWKGFLDSLSTLDFSASHPFLEHRNFNNKVFDPLAVVSCWRKRQMNSAKISSLHKCLYSWPHPQVSCSLCNSTLRWWETNPNGILLNFWWSVEIPVNTMRSSLGHLSVIVCVFCWSPKHVLNGTWHTCNCLVLKNFHLTMCH